MALLPLILAAAGCGDSRPARIAAPEIDPEAVATDVFGRADRDRDATLSATELKALPSVAAAADAVDANRDGGLARAEFIAWLEALRASRVALTPVFATVTLRRKPLAGGVVRLIPEPFMGNAMQAAEGTTDAHGNAIMTIPGAAKPGVNLGLYRVEITSPQTAVPAAYNTKTSLGTAIGIMLPADGVLAFQLDAAP